MNIDRAACVIATGRLLEARDLLVRTAAAAAAADEKEKDDVVVRLLPIRLRSRGERHSLRTFPVVTLHPRFPFNVRLTGETFD